MLDKIYCVLTWKDIFLVDRGWLDSATSAAKRATMTSEVSSKENSSSSTSWLSRKIKIEQRITRIVATLKTKTMKEAVWKSLVKLTNSHDETSGHTCR